MIGVFGARTGAEELAALAPSVRDGWMGMGPQVAAFEAALGDRLGAPLVMVDSGSNALHAAVAALGLPPGSDVLVPSWTWIACANAVALAGHRPVFVDVEEATQNVTAELCAAVLTPRAAAIMVVHYAGKPVDVGAVAALGLPVLEDAAHAIDSALDGRACGTLGAAGIYSFDAVKNLATPDGGAVTAQDPDVLERVRSLRYCGLERSGFAASSNGGAAGRWWETAHTAPFPRMLPNDVSASIGLAQLDRLAANQARRAAIWAHYQRELGELGWLITPEDPGPRERHSWFTYFVRVTDGRRDALAHALLGAGIYTTMRYPPLHRMPAFGAQAQRLPVSERLAETGLNLPLHPALTDAEVDQVVTAVQGF
ncbi:DegT/DnrJ/EryC1/StrS family aminotransferase [Conexibacter woesei]|uniref:DegT/DnrJ/EryC1/StrS family aminotransferase n=1 Tax=Conexibacter woesei TaxID=191495 RepID=UPI00040D0E06|nr:DegT/DnrJ/EryC1/StrS family aminotransferase [Conexibacter woesei]